MTATSVILVTVDCLRADHVSFLGYDRPTTPFLDSLAAENCIFHAATAAGVPTYYSLPSILASRPSLSLGRDVLGIAPGEPTIASVLQDHGYRTAAFSAANPYISARFGYDKGFELFEDFLGDEVELTVSTSESNSLNRALDRISHRLGPLGNLYDELYFQYCQRWATSKPVSLAQLRRFPSADIIVERATSWLETVGDSPFFLWLHLMDPHAPYYPSPEAQELMSVPKSSPFQTRYLNSYWNRDDIGVRRLQSSRSKIVDLYDAGIRWVDAQLDRLVQALRGLGLWENCLFALTADHGEEFLEHGGRFHAPTSLFQETLHVPLLLRIPSAKTNAQVQSPFSLVHLAPTLLDAIQIQSPAEFCGRSAWEQLSSGQKLSEVAIAECIKGCTNPYWPKQRWGTRLMAIRHGFHKLIMHFDGHPDELFDLELDPRELSPLPDDAERNLRRELMARAREHLSNERNDLFRLRALVRDYRLEWPTSVA